jgi:hypothetical protein
VAANSVTAKSGDTVEAAQQGEGGLVPAVPGSFLTDPNEGEPLVIALNFLQANRAELNMSEAEVSNLIIQDQYLSQRSGITHIYLVQSHGGIEVYNGVININIAADGSVINAGSRAVSNLTAAVQETELRLSAVEAVEKAAEQLGLALTQTPAVQEVIGGAAQAVVIGSSGISQNPIPVRLIYQPLADGSVRLAWNVIIYELSGDNWWDVRVDAATGQMLDKSNLVIHDNWGSHQGQGGQVGHDSGLHVPLSASAVPSSYLVYAMPVESPNYAAPAPPADARTTVIAPWLDAPTASPEGWHATSATSWTNTQGNNVDSHKIATRFECGASLECDPPLDLTVTPTTADNVNSATVNLFYWNNIIHDVTYEYGFDEAAGNFQNDNFGLGGLGNDRVNANAQAAGNCNATFGTGADGSPPTMNMFLCNIATPSRDGDLDNGVIAHEYGHGVSNRLTGGPGNVNCLNNAEQMGEGWSDLLGLLLTMETGDAGTDTRPIGTWLLGQGPNGSGVRAFPYTTNMAVNPHTYNSIIGAAIPHGVGSVWAAIVWEAVWALTDAHGFNADFYGDHTTGGNNLAIQLILDGMKLQPCSPGFVNGRDAILLADQNLTGGQNQCLLWTAFAKRGLGFSASQGSNNSTGDGTQAFDLPAACDNAPVLNLSTNQMGGTLGQGQLLTQSLTISNTGLSDLDWTIAEGSAIVAGGCGTPGNLPWVTVSPTAGTTSAGDSDDVAVVFDATALALGVYEGELCVTSNDPNNLEEAVTLSLTVEQSNYEIFLPAVLKEDAAAANSPIGLLPLAGLLLPAAIIGWRKQNR